jgi:hypothetical protein
MDTKITLRFDAAIISKAKTFAEAQKILLSSLKAGCKWIITEDKGDFHFSKTPVVTARQLLEEHVL